MVKCFKCIVGFQGVGFNVVGQYMVNEWVSVQCGCDYVEWFVGICDLFRCFDVVNDQFKQCVQVFVWIVQFCVILI